MTQSGLLRLTHHSQHPVVDVLDAVFDPPIKVVRISGLIIEGTSDGMIVHSDEIEPREVRI